MERVIDWSEELNVAVKVVHMACFLCQRVQESLVSTNRDQVQSKDDDSLVTIADWSVQALISWILSETFGPENISIVAEEDAKTLSEPESTALLSEVTSSVNDCLSKAPKYRLKPPPKPLTSSQILEAIARCNSSGGPGGKHWVLDPVDGTLGFVRGDQYAIALALIEDGKVVLGVLGCPNYPIETELLSYSLDSDLDLNSKKKKKRREKGCVMYAERGRGEARMQALCRESEVEWSKNSGVAIRVSSIDDPALATFCEPVERANSNHSFTRGLVYSVGLRKQPLRVHSMVKYAAIARGDAEIFMKFAGCGYKEKIWDHAAGVVIVEEAGGVVTDAGGEPLNFSAGIFLDGLDRGIVACSGPVLHQKLISAVFASWDSSNL